MSAGGLVSRWRARAAELEPYAPVAARAFEDAAQELERALAETEGELLSLKQAAAVSGYSADHLARLVRSGRIPNYGKPHAPRLRRGDLPTKPRALPARRGALHLGTPRQAARVVLRREDAAP